MDRSDKKEILVAFSSLVAHVDKRFDSLDSRMDSLESRVDGLGTSVSSIEKRLDEIEDSVMGMNRSLDIILEGGGDQDKHILITRKEYDSLMQIANLPNRFQSVKEGQ